jgi:hypothetical protein
MDGQNIYSYDDRAFVEGLGINNFKIIGVINRFLQYGTKSHYSKVLFLIQHCLRLRPAWRFYGRQSFIYSYKPI